MPRHLISDAHEWINEIPTIPIYYLAKPQPGILTVICLTNMAARNAHEWINEIPTIPIYYLAKPQPGILTVICLTNMAARLSIGFP
jgi:hypothetical protein